jgi:transposase
MATIRGEHVTVIWAGVDAGKGHHHCVVIDESARHLLSRRAANDEEELLRLLADTLALGEDVTWGIDLADGGAPLLIDLLLSHGQHVLHIPGMAVNRASEGYRGEGKTDAKDAAIIADQARIRRDLQVLRPGDELVAQLKILTRHRRDLADDRTRVVNRLRGHLTGIFPGLERALDLTNVGPLILLTGYQPPAAIRRAGVRVWKPGCATARSAAPPNWPRPPWRPLSASRPACSGRSRQPSWCTPWRRR